MKFAKAHGLGNDFLLVEASYAAGQDQPAWARRLCERHLGIGADGLILFEAAGDGPRMRLLNADGGEAEISGNGLRCLAAYLVWGGRVDPAHTVQTAAGARAVDVRAEGGARFRVAADLGRPVLASDLIPMSLDPPRAQVLEEEIEVEGRCRRITAVSMGNPHCTLFLTEPPEDALLASLGSALERHPLFPRRTNVELATVVGPRELRVRFWERGVGPTRSSGTGAAAAAVAAILGGRVERRVQVVCDGGLLEVDWAEDGPVRQTGDVEILFEGEWLG